MSQRSRRNGRSHRRNNDEEGNSDIENLSNHDRRANTRNKNSMGHPNGLRSNALPLASQDVLMSQPSTSSRRSMALREDISDESFENSQSTQNNRLTIEEENNLIGNVVNYLLIADHSKTLIQRANIIKAAMPNQSKHYKHIMPKVKKTMKEVFGYNLIELEGSKYILTNYLDNSDSHLKFSESERSEQVLLFITLTHIFMTNESGCSEADLFDFFRALDIIEDTDFKHDYFGDVKYLVTDKFIKQGYLKVVTIEKSEPVIQHYVWGVRAKHELSPRRVMEFMSKLYDGRALNSWPVQYKKLQSLENLDTSQ